ncbi:MAG: HupE/UreJ family protein [Gemmatimonadaceae bacterium]|nr:HupE/UreJ family protein [Gemmatimonadaceae bacterium]
MPARSTLPRTLIVALRHVLLLVIALGATAIAAHEIPSRVTVFAYVKPEGQRLQLLLRVPLAAMRDMEFPERGAGYLDIPRLEPFLRDAVQLWISDQLHFTEDGRELGAEEVAAIRVSLPSDRAFESFGTALAQVRGPRLGDDVDIPWQQAMLDVLLEVPITSDSARFAFNPSLAGLGIQTTTVLRFLPPGGAVRAFQYIGNPGVVELDPGWWQAASQFVVLGFEHILDGIDHLLFVLCLVIPVRRLRPLVAIVTAFTVAHSITLVSAAAGLAPDALWFPPLVETLIALSIVWMAFENIVGVRLEHRWKFAFGFGLVHGFGFSFALRESLQFSGDHLLASLLAFNVGVELGQLLVVLIAIPVLAFTFRRIVDERMGTILLSALVAHTAWHWMLDRGSSLGDYDWQLPAWDAQLAITVMRVAMLVLVVGLVAWALHGLVRRFAPPAVGRDVARSG